VANTRSLGTTLGVAPPGFSFYTDGTSWSSIAGWTVPGTLPAGATLLLAVDLSPNGVGCSAVPANVSNFTTLATYLATLGVPVIVRLGWEFDIATGPWGAGVNGNTPALYVAAFQAAASAIRAAFPAVKIDWCCNVGTSNLTQLQSYYPSSTPPDFVGGDHYDSVGGGGDFSAFGPVVQMAHNVGKPVSCAEWGLATSGSAGTDDPQFISNAAQFFLNPVGAAGRYGFASYTVGYQSLFSALNSAITSWPNSEAKYVQLFG
jgi:hypothetical protein